GRVGHRRTYLIEGWAWWLESHKGFAARPTFLCLYSDHVTTRILVVQPEETVPVGTLGDWLSEAGAALDTVRADVDDIPPAAEGYDAVVCLGGGMGPLDDEQHPWLPAVRALLAASVAAEVPTLGVCLGGQLLGAATGGTVGRGRSGPEAGPKLVSKKDAAWTDPLFADLPLMPDVL